MVAMKEIEKSIVKPGYENLPDYIEIVHISGDPIFSNDILNFWSPLGVIKGEEAGYEVGICEIKKPFFYFDRMEAHRHSEEILIPVNRDMFVPLAPPGDSPNINSLSLIKVELGELIVLKEGVWHFAAGPIESGGDNLKYFVLLKKGTPQEDLKMVNLDAKIIIKL